MRYVMSCHTLSLKHPTPSHIYISVLIGNVSDLYSARNRLKSGPRNRYSARAFIFTLKMAEQGPSETFINFLPYAKHMHIANSFLSTCSTLTVRQNSIDIFLKLREKWRKCDTACFLKLVLHENCKNC
jgi:hypothetical protein